MNKIIKIATEHSINRIKETQEINLKMQGGSPYFAYLWIDDVIYTLTKTDRNIKITKTK